MSEPETVMSKTTSSGRSTIPSLSTIAVAERKDYNAGGPATSATANGPIAASMLKTRFIVTSTVPRGPSGPRPDPRRPAYRALSGNQS